MTNREKFAEKILDIACNGNWMAINKATLEPIKCQELPCKDWVCCNQDSEYVADWTDYTDCCEEWESRDEM